MAQRQNKTEEIASRRAIVAERYLSGMTQVAIGREVGVDASSISLDLKAIRAEWKESRIRDFDEAKAVELAKLDKTEREGWLAWERSQTNAVKVKTTEDGSGEKVEKWSEGQTGDPRFLQIVQTCIQKRCDILGLDAPTKWAQTDGEGNDLSPDSGREEANRILDILAERAGINGPAPSGNGHASGDGMEPPPTNGQAE